MEGPLPTALILEYKKTAPYPPWDKSCTPAIPPKLTFQTSARFTRHHACPMDNGWVPVGIYLVSRSSRPRKSIHSAAPRPDPTTQDSLVHSPAAPRPDSTIRDSLKVCRTGYYSFSQVSCCLVVGAIIAAPPPVCQASIFPDADLFSTAPAPGRKPAARKKRFRRRAKLQFNSKKGKLPYTSNIRSP